MFQHLLCAGLIGEVGMQSEYGRQIPSLWNLPVKLSLYGFLTFLVSFILRRFVVVVAGGIFFFFLVILLSEICFRSTIEKPFFS